jgi:hypothetical protein
MRTNDIYIKYIEEWFKNNENLSKKEYNMLKKLVWIQRK